MLRFISSFIAFIELCLSPAIARSVKDKEIRNIKAQCQNNVIFSVFRINDSTCFTNPYELNTIKIYFLHSYKNKIQLTGGLKVHQSTSKLKYVKSFYALFNCMKMLC